MAPSIHNSHHVESFPLDQLKFFEHRVRKHSAAQIVKIGTSLDRFGCVLPIGITADGYVVCGEARVLAAIQIGWKNIPAIVIDHMSEEEIRVFRIADNRLAEDAEWDPVQLRKEFLEIQTFGIDLQFTGFEIPEIDITLGVPPRSSEEDDIEQLANDGPVVSRVGDLFEIGPHRILCGDALLGENYTRLLARKIAAMSITDPPYNVRIKGHVSGSGRHSEFVQASGEMSVEEYRIFLATFLGLMERFIRPGGTAFVFQDWRSIAKLIFEIENAGLDMINLCVWAKTNAGMGSLYRSMHELVVVARKPGGEPINNVQLGKYGRSRTNIWQFAGANSIGSEARELLDDHPTPKPVSMLVEAILDVTKRGDIVLDPFGGSGSTLIAAHNTGRAARLIELEPGFVDLTIRRAEKVLGLSAICARTGRTFEELAAIRANARNVRQRERGKPLKRGGKS